MKKYFVPAIMAIVLALPVAAATDDEQALAQLADELGMSVDDVEDAIPNAIAGIFAPLVHSQFDHQFAQSPLGTQLQLLGSMVYHQPDVVALYCSPTWICNVGCGIAHGQCQRPCDNTRSSCLSRADRAEIECAKSMSGTCFVTPWCRERHLAKCAEQAESMRENCRSAYGNCLKDCGLKQVNCKTCCYDNEEGSFDLFGLNLCVQRHFGI